MNELEGTHANVLYDTNDTYSKIRLVLSNPDTDPDIKLEYLIRLKLGFCRDPQDFISRFQQDQFHISVLYTTLIGDSFQSSNIVLFQDNLLIIFKSLIHSRAYPVDIPLFIHQSFRIR